MGSILLKLSEIPLIGLYGIDLVYPGAEGGVFKYRVAVICTKIYESCSFREAYKGVLLFGCGLALLKRRTASRQFICNSVNHGLNRQIVLQKGGHAGDLGLMLLVESLIEDILAVDGNIGSIELTL